MAKYVPPTQDDTSSFKSSTTSPSASSSSSSSPNDEEAEKNKTKKNPLYPKVGDFVRYYDLDGGKADGQVLIGKISFIQKNIKQKKTNNDSSSSSSGWTVELTEMEDIGNGCYIDYGSNKRLFKKAIRDLQHVSPVTANFVRVENAYKVPMSSTTGLPIVKQPQYDIDDGYEGPFAYNNDNQINQSVIENDFEIYQALKAKLFRYVALAGLAGTIGTNLVKGTEDAVIYAAGFVASLVYLFLLTVKTDTMAGNERLGKNIANLRFAMPLLVLVGVSLYNASRGENNPVVQGGQGGILFETVTAEQFAAAIIGFLTYRLPLFFIQIQEAFQGGNDNEESSSGKGGGGIRLPGSAGIALQVLTGGGDKAAAASSGGSSASLSGLVDSEQLPTVFLVSGPQFTGRPALVQRFIQEGEGKFVEPQKVDRVQDGAVFERLEQRGEFISIDPTGRFGLTRKSVKDAALQAAAAAVSSSESDDPPQSKVAVISADVELAKKIVQISGIRLVGVWVGLNSVKEFEDRLGQEIDSGKLVIPEDETRETVIRSKIRDIVKEIEYGISSGIFEFTILNDNDDTSLAQLREAATYCFK
jgi:hypothetical protein